MDHHLRTCICIFHDADDRSVMYLIAERLKRPMRRLFGGKWISMLGIPPLTILFIPLMFVTMIRHRMDMVRRWKKLRNSDTVNHAFFGSWF